MNTYRTILKAVLFVTSGMLLAGCACPGSGPVAPTEEVMVTEESMATEETMATEEMMTTEEPMATEETIPEWQADGAVLDGEYPHEATIGEVRLWWRNDAQFLYLAMEAPTTGWVAVGLDPTNRMQGANFVFGMIVEGEAQIWDAYGTAPTGNTHPPDEELGGTNDIVAYAGVEESGVTRFEVQIPLDSGDEFDKPLQSGNTYAVIVAVGPTDDYNARHSSRAAGEIVLD